MEVPRVALEIVGDTVSRLPTRRGNGAEVIMCKRLAVMLTLSTLTPPTAVYAAPIVFEVGGSSAPSSIQPTVDNFRAALGAPNNGNNAGPLLNGRREINWDGGGSTANSDGATPLDVFLNTRGARFTTPGTGFVQAPASAGDSGDDLGTFFSNPTYDTTFGAFSPARVFVPLGSNVTDVLFYIPGTGGAIAATVSGFGAVFTDVDVPNITGIALYDMLNNLLYQRHVPAGTVADQSLSFLGVIFDAGERISRVRITAGNSTLSASSNDNPANNVDLVAIDDVLYSEPSAGVPEPTTLALFGLGLAGIGAIRRKKVAPESSGDLRATQ
jgi:hypothetical protein